MVLEQSKVLIQNFEVNDEQYCPTLSNGVIQYKRPYENKESIIKVMKKNINDKLHHHIDENHLCNFIDDTDSKCEQPLMFPRIILQRIDFNGTDNHTKLECHTSSINLSSSVKRYKLKTMAVEPKSLELSLPTKVKSPILPCEPNNTVASGMNGPNAEYKQTTPVMNGPNAEYKQSTPVIDGPNAEYKQTTFVMNRPNIEYKQTTPVMNRPNAEYKRTTPVMNGPNAECKQAISVMNRPNAEYKRTTPVMNGPNAEYKQAISVMNGPNTEYKQTIPVIDVPNVENKQTTSVMNGPNVEYKQTTSVMDGPNSKYKKMMVPTNPTLTKKVNKNLSKLLCKSNNALASAISRPKVKYKQPTTYIESSHVDVVDEIDLTIEDVHIQDLKKSLCKKKDIYKDILYDFFAKFNSSQHSAAVPNSVTYSSPAANSLLSTSSNNTLKDLTGVINESSLAETHNASVKPKYVAVVKPIKNISQFIPIKSTEYKHTKPFSLSSKTISTIDDRRIVPYCSAVTYPSTAISIVDDRKTVSYCKPVTMLPSTMNLNIPVISNTIVNGFGHSLYSAKEKNSVIPNQTSSLNFGDISSNSTGNNIYNNNTCNILDNVINCLGIDVLVISVPSLICPFIFQKPRKKYLNRVQKQVEFESSNETIDKDDAKHVGSTSLNADSQDTSENNQNHGVYLQTFLTELGLNIVHQYLDKKSKKRVSTINGNVSNKNLFTELVNKNSVQTSAVEITCVNDNSNDGDNINTFVRTVNTFSGCISSLEQSEKNLHITYSNNFNNEETTDSTLNKTEVTSVHKFASDNQLVSTCCKKYKSFDQLPKKCKMCNFKTQSVLVMADHLKIPHYMEKKYCCNFCPFKVNDTDIILYHMEEEHNIKAKLQRYMPQHQCLFCNFTSIRAPTVDNHVSKCQAKFDVPGKENSFSTRVWRFQNIRIDPFCAEIFELTTTYKFIQDLLLRDIKMINPLILERFRSIESKIITPGAHIPFENKQWTNISLNSKKEPKTYSRNVSKKVSTNGIAHKDYLITPLKNENEKNGVRKDNWIAPSNKSKNPDFDFRTRYFTLCELCGEFVRNNCNLLLHKCLVHNSANANSSWKNGYLGKSGSFFILCELCGRYMMNTHMLIDHMKLVHSITSTIDMKFKEFMECRRCFIIFFTHYSLDKHVKENHENVGPSPQEHALFDVKRSLNLLNNLISKEPYKTEEIPENLQNHLISKQPRKSKEISKNLQDHSNPIKLRKNEWICEVCNKVNVVVVFRVKRSYYNHIKKFHMKIPCIRLMDVKKGLKCINKLDPGLIVQHDNLSNMEILDSNNVQFNINNKMELSDKKIISNNGNLLNKENKFDTKHRESEAIHKMAKVNNENLSNKENKFDTKDRASKVIHKMAKVRKEGIKPKYNSPNNAAKLKEVGTKYMKETEYLKSELEYASSSSVNINNFEPMNGIRLKVPRIVLKRL